MLVFPGVMEKSSYFPHQYHKNCADKDPWHYWVKKQKLPHTQTATQKFVHPKSFQQIRCNKGLVPTTVDGGSGTHQLRLVVEIPLFIGFFLHHPRWLGMGFQSLTVSSQSFSSWWLVSPPIWKICSSNWIISPGIGIKIKTYLKPPV